MKDVGWKLTAFGLCAATPLLIPGGLSAASFECNRAETRIEKMICAEAELSKLDDDLAGAYAIALENRSQSDTKEALKNDQKTWLKERNTCGDTSCVKSSYVNRLAALAKLSGKSEHSVTPVIAPAVTDNEKCLAPNIDWRNYQWILIVGNGKTACEEMLAYLKSRPKDQPPPVCAEDRLPPNGHWTRPDWQEISPELKERFIASLPKDKEKPSLKRAFSSCEFKVTHTDISGDGIPEYLLALIHKKSVEWCRLSPFCASSEKDEWKGYVRLNGELYYELMPLRDDGMEIDWQHKCIAPNTHMETLNEYIGSGELIFYKKRPYWLSTIFWNQKIHDNYKNFRNDPNDPYSRTFELAPLAFDQLDDDTPASKPPPASFDNLGHIGKNHLATCYFGYFHRNNLKNNPPRRRR